MVAIAGKTHFGPREQFPFEYLKDSNVMPAGKNHVLWTDLEPAAVDLSLVMLEDAGALRGIWMHAAERVGPRLVGRVTRQWSRLLEMAVADPGRRTEELCRLLREDEAPATVSGAGAEGSEK